VIEDGSAFEPGRSHHAMVDRPDRAGDAALQARHATIRELGDALRELVEDAVNTEVAEDELRQVAAIVRTAAKSLRANSRELAQLPSADDLLGGIRVYNPVTGDGSALAPPLRIEMVDGVAVGTCSLGRAFEGPPTYAHGGVSAMLLDQLLGYAASAAGHPGMTIRLDTSYRAPVPLRTPLRLAAEVTNVDGRRVTVEGTIATAAEPDKALVRATGMFLTLRPERAARLFDSVRDPDAKDPSVAHD
jgi:acyl-coenzyme A thioesterase PaaI-like protein